MGDNAQKKLLSLAVVVTFMVLKIPLKKLVADLVRRYGFEEAAETIQNLYLEGRKFEAVAAVPNELVDAVALVGPKARIKDRLQLWLDSDVTTMNLQLPNIETVQFMAECVL